MTNFSKIKSMTVDELAEWLYNYSQFENTPWMLSFDEKYCNKCELIEVRYEDTRDALGIDPLLWGHPTKCAFCEVDPKKCRFFPGLDTVPSSLEMITMWLNEEADENGL